VLGSVTRLTPRLGSFPDALTAFRAARFQTCLAKLNGIDSVPAATLRARTFLRLGDPRAARASLQADAAMEHRDRSEVALLLGVAHSRLGDRSESDDAFRDAFVYSVSSLDVGLEAEVKYYKAAASFGEGDLAGGRAACLQALEIALAPAAFAKTGGNVPLDHVVSRIQELLGAIAAAEGHYGEWLQYARAALNTLDRCNTPDVFQEAFAVRNLTLLARDFDIADDARHLAGRVPSFAWTDDVCRVEFTTVEALGWCSALRGDVVGALRLFRRASAAASTEPEHVYVAVDRALVAREFGHRAMALEETEHALNIADRYDWNKAPGDYRLALLVLAQAAASLTPVRARETLDRYTGIRNSMDATFAARIEPRARAEEAYTHGLVLRAEGRLTVSKERLQFAFETWEAIGFKWRAARAALELAELDAGELFRRAVRREVIQRPDSVFSARARLVA